MDGGAGPREGEKRGVLESVSSNGYKLQSASNEMKADRDVVEAAVANNGGALRFASDELK